MRGLVYKKIKHTCILYKLIQIQLTMNEGTGLQEDKTDMYIVQTDPNSVDYEWGDWFTRR